MPIPIFKTLAIGSALLLGAVFLWTPWVTFLDAQSTQIQVGAFLENTRIRELLEQVPQLKEPLGIAKLENLQDVRELFADPEIRELYEISSAQPHFTGFDLAFRIGLVQPFLRVLLIFLPILSLVTLLWMLVSLRVSSTSPARVVNFALTAAVFLVTILFLWYVPSLYTLGEQDNFQLAFACMLLGTRTGVGVWLALLAMLGMGLGVLLDTFMPNENVQEELYDSIEWST